MSKTTTTTTNGKKVYTALGYEKRPGALSDKTLAARMVGVFNASLHSAGIATSFVNMPSTSHTENGIKATFGGNIEFQVFFDDKRYKCCVHNAICNEVVKELPPSFLFRNPYTGRGYEGGYKYHAKWTCAHEFSIAREEKEATLPDFIEDVVAFLALCIGTTKTTATSAENGAENVTADNVA